MWPYTVLESLIKSLIFLLPEGPSWNFSRGVPFPALEPSNTNKKRRRYEASSHRRQLEDA
jgi:hypothetical protein